MDIENIKGTKTLEEGFNQELQERRKKFIKDNESNWKTIGQKYKKYREASELEIKDVAESLGISSQRLMRFEEGGAVTDARLIKQAYRLFFKLWESVADNFNKELINDVDVDDMRIKDAYNIFNKPYDDELNNRMGNCIVKRY